MRVTSRVVGNRFHSLTAIFIACVTNITAPALAETWFVDGWIPQSGLGTGGWSNAKKYLQEALLEAIPGDIINIATGVYYVADGVPSGEIPTGPRDLSFVMPEGVELHGGWPTQGGPTDSEEERNAIAFPVVLSGDRLKDDVSDEESAEAELAGIFDSQNFSLYADNVYHVVIASGVTSATVLEGITIRGGHADEPGSRGNGAGIYAPNGTPTLRSCVVEFNRTKVSTPPADPGAFSLVDGAGGGLYATDGGALTIQDTTFRYNQALWGAGLFRGPLDADPITAHVNLIGCRLERNRCFTSGVAGARPRGGGALFEINTGVIRIESCEFLHNTCDLSSGGSSGGSALVVSLPPTCTGSPCSSCYECTSGCTYSPPGCGGMACPACPTNVFIINSLFAGSSNRGAGATIKMNRKAIFQDCTIAWNVREGPCTGGNSSAGVLIGHVSHSEFINSILYDNQDLSCPIPLLQQQASFDTTTGG